jgi:prophage antirepressor-like protein
MKETNSKKVKQKEPYEVKYGEINGHIVRSIFYEGMWLSFAEDVAEAYGFEDVADAIDRYCWHRLHLTMQMPKENSKDKNVLRVLELLKKMDITEPFVMKEPEMRKYIVIPSEDVERMKVASKPPTKKTFQQWVWEYVLPNMENYKKEYGEEFNQIMAEKIWIKERKEKGLTN